MTLSAIYNNITITLVEDEFFSIHIFGLLGTSCFFLRAMISLNLYVHTCRIRYEVSCCMIA